MIYIETCPKCGSDLVSHMLASYPPVPHKHCSKCGWQWTGKAEQVVRVPFNTNPEAEDSDWAKLDEGDNLTQKNVLSLTQEPITFYEDNCLATFPNTNAGEIYNTAFNNKACINCPNNVKNGGSGNCNCTLGQMEITV